MVVVLSLGPFSMDVFLLQQLDTSTVPRAINRLLTRALAEYRSGGIREMAALANTARQISLDCSDGAAEAISLVFIGTAYGQRSEFRRAKDSLQLARTVFRRQPAWRHRKNEAIALYCLGLAYQRSPTPSVADAVASFQKALDALESVRCQYELEGDDRGADTVDELCAELIARIDAEVDAPIIDGMLIVSDAPGVARLAQPSATWCVDSSQPPQDVLL
jgi:hypothetical protein